MAGRTRQSRRASKSEMPAAPFLLRKDIWPDERDVMMRPDRVKYVRKLVKPVGCVFCSAAKKGPGFESLCVYRGRRAMVVLNKFPYNTGHALVLPVRHCGDLLQLKDAEFNELQLLLRETIRILRDAYKPTGLNVGLNLGAAAGAGIPDHLHYHVIPRWHGDTNFFPLIADTKVVVETLEQTYDRLLPSFKRLVVKR